MSKLNPNEHALSAKQHANTIPNAGSGVSGAEVCVTAIAEEVGVGKGAAALFVSLSLDGVCAVTSGGAIRDVVVVEALTSTTGSCGCVLSTAEGRTSERSVLSFVSSCIHNLRVSVSFRGWEYQ